MSASKWTRRQALGTVGAIFGGAALTHSQSSAGAEGGRTKVATVPARLPPREELVNVPEFEEMAKLKLPSPVFTAIASESREAFDRITLRPRALVPTLNLDISVDLFGDQSWTPMVVGALPDQKRFHPDGELATAKGASAAKAIMMVSSRSSVPLEQIAAQAKTPLWYQISAYEAEARAHIEQAAATGCKTICMIVSRPANGAGGTAGTRRIDWDVVDRLRQGVHLPLLVQGISTPDEATMALRHGVGGLIVSRPDALQRGATTMPIEVLSGIVDVVAGKVPVLLDDTIQRGADVFKAVALGARGVLVTKPAMWGLATYGAEGVQSVLALLLAEFARTMGSCGKVNINALNRTAVKIHAAVRNG